MPLPHPNPSLKRNREENWSDEEKRSLLSLIKMEITIVEDKSTESNTNKKKNLVWKDIAEKLHMMTGKNRPTNKIIDQWKRMKGQAKKNIAAFQKARRATGGGQNRIKVTDLDWAVKEVVPHYFFHDKNPYDADGHENQVDMEEVVTQHSPSLLRDFPPSQPSMDIVGMGMRDRNDDTCTTYYSEQSPSHHQHIEPSIIVQEFDVIQTEGHSPVIPFRELGETPRQRIQRTPVLPTREINFNLRNETEPVEDDSPPNDRPAPRARAQKKRKFNEMEYHKMLIKKKEREFDGKNRVIELELKNMDEIHKLELKNREELYKLEVKKRKTEIEILELTKLKLQKDLGINID